MDQPNLRCALKPHEIIYPENTPIFGGLATCVYLSTLGSLKYFWGKNRRRFPFAAERGGHNETLFLLPYEWIFAADPETLIKAVTRWDEIGISPSWYDWDERDPGGRAEQIRHLERLRESSGGKLSAKDEAEYALMKSGEYNGWWELTNLPYGFSHYDWFCTGSDWEIRDKHFPADELKRHFIRLTYEEWSARGSDMAFLHDANGVDKCIADCELEKAQGNEYYGCENE